MSLRASNSVSFEEGNDLNNNEIGITKAVYILLGLAHFTYHESVISELSNNGYAVELLVLKKDGYGAAYGMTTVPTFVSFQKFLRQHPNVSVAKLDKSELQDCKFCEAMRLLKTSTYYSCNYHRDSYLRKRWQRDTYIILGVDSRLSKVLNALLYIPGLRYLFQWLDDLHKPKEEMLARLQSIKPDIVFSSPGNMRRARDAEWVKAAKYLNIPTAIVVLSWDNLTTKGLLHVKPDVLMVWNDYQKDLGRRIHNIQLGNISVVGAPFFDKWHDKSKFKLRRKRFARKLAIDSKKDYIIYFGSSRNIANNESWLIKQLILDLNNLDREILKNLGIHVRPHGSNQKISRDLSELPITISPAEQCGVPFSEERKEFLFNLIYHSKLVIGLNTSALIDAIILDRPCISIDTGVYVDSHTESEHFKTILESGSVLLAKGTNECAEIIRDHIGGHDPTKDARREFVKQYILGNQTKFSAAKNIVRISDNLLGR